MSMQLINIGGKNMNVLAIIPARSGSKSVVDKNIRLINGKPLLAYSIEHAKASRYINRIILSTDSEKYAKIGKSYGAEIPFVLRCECGNDTARDILHVRHALTFLGEKEGYYPDIVVQLRPTYPIRCPKDIDNMIELLVNNPTADSVRCIVPSKEIAYKMWRKSEDERIQPLLSDIKEAYNMPRQALPKIYYQNACIDVIRASVITEKNSMSGSHILGYEMPHNFDIDTEKDFADAALYIKLKESYGNKFVFDIDGVIAQFNESLDYASSAPNENMISIINELYNMGNYIILFTARGYKTGIDSRSTTESQLVRWGVKYHELKFGKPDATFYIDDKMVDMNTLLEVFKK